MTGMLSIMQKLDKLRRIIATGFCFALFGVGGLCLTFVVLPLLTRSIKDKTERELKVQGVIQKNFDFFCRTMKSTGCIDYRIIGAELLRQDRNCIIVANHPSLIDYVLIASCLPQCDCLVKAAIWHNPFIKAIVKAAGYIPNQAPDSLLNDCSERLKYGNVLLIFPEGTRTTPGQPSTLQRGAAQIAVRTGTDMRLVHITVTPNFLTKEKMWYQVPDSKPFFKVEVKGKIPVSDFLTADSQATAARNLNRHLAHVLFPEPEQ
ncbi:MAG: 1-acyl-sn-glycerol-3-phosphate acyltransferase [Shewanella sp.]|nr:1-acyl-sn-glycerol-3-phosphate acyltransferase [Shewanella sp.]MCF1431120.1 1-acyl-sn-glycerol-3-phosphate acyltransferase [Shewanella sp.]MCF1458672.1 1-acyl-sn-glycerol-3-phosphate acyltransferase [Shewanella sp.]